VQVFLDRYKSLCPATWPHFDGTPRAGTETLMRHLGYTDDLFKLGNTKVGRAVLGCLEAWLPACLLACLLALLLVCLRACLLAYLLACLQAGSTYNQRGGSNSSGKGCTSDAAAAKQYQRGIRCPTWNKSH